MKAVEHDEGLAAHVICTRELHAVSRLEQVRGSSCRLVPCPIDGRGLIPATSIHPPRFEYLTVLKEQHLEMLTRLQTTSREDAA